MIDHMVFEEQTIEYKLSNAVYCTYINDDLVNIDHLINIQTNKTAHNSLYTKPLPNQVKFKISYFNKT